MRSKFSTRMVIVVAGTLYGCGGAGIPELNSPQDYLNDPFISDAVNDSGFETNSGDNPPSVSGKYALDGSVTATTVPGTFADTLVDSTVCLFDQAVGSIRYAEQVEGFSGEGIGTFIQGDNEQFTIYGLSTVDLGTYFPELDGCSQTATTMVSGIQDGDGNIEFSVLNTYVAFAGCPSEYDTLLGTWYSVSATGSLLGECSGPQDL